MSRLENTLATIASYNRHDVIYQSTNKPTLNINPLLNNVKIKSFAKLRLVQRNKIRRNNTKFTKVPNTNEIIPPTITDTPYEVRSANIIRSHVNPTIIIDIYISALIDINLFSHDI